MKFRRTTPGRRPLAVVRPRPRRLRRRRRRRRPPPSPPVAEAPEFEAGHDDGRARRGRRDQRRHQVRPARLRPGEPRRRGRGLRRRDRQDHRRRARHRRRRTSSASRPRPRSARRSSRATRSTWSSRPTRSTTSARSGSPSPARTTQAGQQIMVAADDDTITGPESLTENPDAKVCSRHRLDAVGEHPRVPRQRRPAGAVRGVLAVRRRARATARSTRSPPTTSSCSASSPSPTARSSSSASSSPRSPTASASPKGDVAFCEFINETLQENEEAYVEAWEATAGQVEGTETPELPEPRRVRLTV